jgi:Fe-Mn family superoxide dismutase
MEFVKVAQPGQHELYPLPYEYNALEPVISTESLRLHHDILQRNYVNGLNNAELKLIEARKNIDYDLINHWENELAFHGSGVILHSIYWTTMAPIGQGGQPGEETACQISKSFGDFSAFQKQFSNVADRIEGSGWAILAWQPAWHRVEIMQAQANQNKTQWCGISILALDMWEHAYYLDYTVRRDEYIRKWWQIVNWKEVEIKLILAMNGQVTLTI